MVLSSEREQYQKSGQGPSTKTNPIKKVEST